MSQSVKLSDGSYIDSTGVYDTSLGMTQQAINNAVSHVGQIIFSTTLDTMEKVVAVYGGTTWSKIEGRFLVGASSSYANGSTGGEATHTLTIDEMPSHSHTVGGFDGILNWSNAAFDYQNNGLHFNSLNGERHYPNDWNGASEYGRVATHIAISPLSTGGSAAHNNMPPYRAVYIWERTA